MPELKENICEHLQKVIDAVKEAGVLFRLNDGWSDWLVCPICKCHINIDCDELQYYGRD